MISGTADRDTDAGSFGSPNMSALVGNVSLMGVDLRQAVSLALSDEVRVMPRSFRFLNAYCVALARQDPEYKLLLNSTGTNFADGFPVARLLRWRAGVDHDCRVRGPSFMSACLAESQGKTVKHFFIGGTEESLRTMVDRLKERFPNLDIAGSYSPPFGPLNQSVIDESVTRAKRSGATHVWVGIGTPKQDYLSKELVASGLTSFSVGAAFDFISGRTREAPLWIQKIGAEWLFRLFSEPRRLWRRYLFGNLNFIRAVLEEGGPAIFRGIRKNSHRKGDRN